MPFVASSYFFGNFQFWDLPTFSRGRRVSGKAVSPAWRRGREGRAKPAIGHPWGKAGSDGVEKLPQIAVASHTCPLPHPEVQSVLPPGCEPWSLSTVALSWLIAALVPLSSVWFLTAWWNWWVLAIQGWTGVLRAVEPLTTFFKVYTTDHVDKGWGSRIVNPWEALAVWLICLRIVCWD